MAGYEQDNKAFRFLTTAEFAALEVSERPKYLVRAQKELAERQRILREQLTKYIDKADDSKS